jgi:hypothetical protein
MDSMSRIPKITDRLPHLTDYPAVYVSTVFESRMATSPSEAQPITLLLI